MIMRALWLIVLAILGGCAGLTDGTSPAAQSVPTSVPIAALPPDQASPTPATSFATPAPAPTPTPAATPDIEATVQTRVEATAAAMPTATPTPTPTPDPLEDYLVRRMERADLCTERTMAELSQERDARSLLYRQALAASSYYRSLNALGRKVLEERFPVINARYVLENLLDATTDARPMGFREWLGKPRSADSDYDFRSTLLAIQRSAGPFLPQIGQDLDDWSAAERRAGLYPSPHATRTTSFLKTML